jgi:hypothetical protein
LPNLLTTTSSSTLLRLCSSFPATVSSALLLCG